MADTTGGRRGAVAVAAVCAAAAAVIVAALWPGPAPGLSPDAVAYLSAAESLRSDGQLVTYTGEPFVQWPPLFPGVLAALATLPVPVDESAHVLLALLFAIMSGIGAYAAARAFGTWPFGVLAGAVIAPSVPLFYVGSFLWSDLVFAALASGALLLFARIERPGALAAAAALTAAAIMTRYVGIALIPVGIAAIAAWRRPFLRPAAIFMLASLGPLAVWVARNLLASSTPLGERREAAIQFTDAARDAAYTIADWIIPGRPTLSFALAVALLIAAISARRVPATRLEWCAGGFALVYTALLLWSASAVSLDPLDDRLLAPLYVPFVWLAVGVCRRVARGYLSNATPTSVAVAVALFVLWLPWANLQRSGLRVVEHTARALSRSQWPSIAPDLAARLRATPKPVYTNAPDALYLSVGVRVPSAPRRTAYRSSEPVDDLARFQHALTSGAALLVWIDGPIPRLHLYDVAELASRFEVRRVARYPAATIYEISTRTSIAQDG